ncbi:iq domain-containing protein iqm6 [Quercus suber]|uniref:Iq domain-containing protein iqm6 n=1 Tax=Quercus suber TaxID=58331 RepID=A0AAW0LFI7_QUESU
MSLMLTAQTTAALIGFHLTTPSSSSKALLVVLLIDQLVACLCGLTSILLSSNKPEDSKAAKIFADIGFICTALGFILMVAMLVPWYLVLIAVLLFGVICFIFLLHKFVFVLIGFKALWNELKTRAQQSPLADLDDLFSSYEAILVRSVSSVVRNILRSVGFNIRDSDSTKLKSYGSRKMILEGSLSFKGRELETVFSFKTPTAEMENDVFGRCVSSKTRDVDDQLAKSDNISEKNHQSPLLEPKNNRNKAALNLQKVYKSFRTKRRLADCAVLVEQSCFRSSISFFDIGKPEIAVSRWSRARTRAAKVGKGLCKVGNAKKPALQHWLEAVSLMLKPRHRYGHNLQFYYVKWLHCESKQPFFYWLNVGEGKEVNHERCPPSKLRQQCIKYFGPAERKAYEVVVQDGKLVYKQSGEDLHTEGGPKDAKWIFVLSTSKTLYVGLKNKGTFQHSSFLAGGATLSVGRLVAEDGILKTVSPHSGHYRPTEENFRQLMSFLKEHNVDLTNVKKCPGEEVQEEALNKNGSDICLWSNPTEARVKIRPSCHTDPPNLSSANGYETAEESLASEEDFMVPKMNLFDGYKEENDEQPFPKEKKILQRVDSHKGMKSYQWAKQLSSK